VVACLEAYKHHKYRTPGTPQAFSQARVAALAALPAPAALLRPVDLAAAASAHAATGRALATAPAVWAPQACLYLHESFLLVPFAVETHGRLGASALRLLRALAVHASGGPDSAACERRRLFQRWRLLLSHAVTRAVSVQAASHPGPLLSSAEACSRVVARRALPDPGGAAAATVAAGVQPAPFAGGLAAGVPHAAGGAGLAGAGVVISAAVPPAAPAAAAAAAAAVATDAAGPLGALAGARAGAGARTGAGAAARPPAVAGGVRGSALASAPRRFAT
jgi:hypothetical protein